MGTNSSIISSQDIGTYPVWAWPHVDDKSFQSLRDLYLLASLQMPNSLNTMGTCLILRPLKRESIILIVLLLLQGLSLHFFHKKRQRTSAVSPYKEAILQWHAVIFLPVEGKAMMYKTSPLMGSKKTFEPQNSVGNGCMSDIGSQPVSRSETMRFPPFRL